MTMQLYMPDLQTSHCLLLGAGQPVHLANQGAHVSGTMSGGRAPLHCLLHHLRPGARQLRSVHAMEQRF